MRAGMSTQKTVSQRHTAAQWARWVKAWKRSGETAEEFATSRGLKPRTLTWWSWRLQKDVSSPKLDEPEALKLVAVEVERGAARTDATAAWELITARGDVLRAYTGASCSDLVAVVHALTSRKEEP